MDCDIIIPVWNQLSFTKDCIDSIKANTVSGYRLVIIDNASDSDTRDYLASLAGKGSPKVLLIRNDTNVGFIKAVNEGMRASGSKFVCVLNNDTITTRGWLKEMIAIADSAKDIGIVNPSSNNLGQRPSNNEPIEHYAESLRAQKGRLVELGSAIGFCMLIKREAIDRIGVFDEIYGMGNFEDTDFSRRAVKEGYRCVRACGAYVYHRESTSFKKVGTFNEDFERNRQIYEFRWGKPKRVAYVLDSYDGNTMMRLGPDSVKLARAGSWVWYFLKDDLDVPDHSNISVVRLKPENFYLSAAFRILKKKKRFDEIFVGTETFGKVLEKLEFIHKAKVRYY